MCSSIALLLQNEVAAKRCWKSAHLQIRKPQPDSTQQQTPTSPSAGGFASRTLQQPDGSNQRLHVRHESRHQATLPVQSQSHASSLLQLHVQNLTYICQDKRHGLVMHRTKWLMGACNHPYGGSNLAPKPSEFTNQTYAKLV